MSRTNAKKENGRQGFGKDVIFLRQPSKQCATALAAAGSRPSPMDGARECLDMPLRVGLTDGRVIYGRFACLDKQQNLLLSEARETRKLGGGAADNGVSERHLGTVLVPRRWVTSCHTAVVT